LAERFVYFWLGICFFVGIAMLKMTICRWFALCAVGWAAMPSLLAADTTPPLLIQVSPTPGVVTNLTRVSVTFSEPVTGVLLSSLRVNDTGCLSMSQSGTTYTYTFAQPAFGPAQFTWDPAVAIFDLASPPNRFDPFRENATFFYELVDASAPVVAALTPPAGVEVRRLDWVEVKFSKPVEGVDAGDLLAGGAPAVAVSGAAEGPYRFMLPPLGAGPVVFQWAANHGIRDVTEFATPFAGGGWSGALNPAKPTPAVRINEFLAANITGLRDEDQSVEDWIELYNDSSQAVSLAGWSLSDDPGNPGQWVFGNVSISANGYLVVFASGKDRPQPGFNQRPHTNFKLSRSGEHLGLYSPDSPRAAVSALDYPPQRNNYSYGVAPGGELRYFHLPTPASSNPLSQIAGMAEPVVFSVARGTFDKPFTLQLYCATPESGIYYTTNGSEPTIDNGIRYSSPLQIRTTSIIRAASFKNGLIPSATATHTYIVGLPVTRRYLPSLSLVTASNNLYGVTGIMEYSPRNTTKTGAAWERPISAEWIRPEDNGGFQIDCGIRLQGGGYVRERYNYRSGELPFSKYSFRLYFRGDYGPGKLDYPLFPDSPLRSFDRVVLRAGMNDHSNPFIRDEFARMLCADVGQVASHGTFAHLFLNGVYKGLYNPAERIDGKFLQDWHGGGADWDVMAAFGEVREGTVLAWSQLKSLIATRPLTVASNYVEVERRMDLTNFVDYLLPLIYADTDDWPHNNWRSARERVPNGRFRMYAWDAEWSFGFAHGPTYNTINGQLSNLSPPWGNNEIQSMFVKLRAVPEFKQLFADRVHKHFFNGGALTDERIKARYEGLRMLVAASIPSFDNSIGTIWIPQRRRSLTNHFQAAGFLASSNAPTFAPFGGRVPAGTTLPMASLSGSIYYTTNGADPRVPFTGAIHPDAVLHDPAKPLTLSADMVLKARTLAGPNNWSALSEAAFTVGRLGNPVQISEIMYNPPGGDSGEFIELFNPSGLPAPLADHFFGGIDFRFPKLFPPLAPGQRIVLASASDPAAFARRYPGITPAGHFGGALSNGGERLTLSDPQGNIVLVVDYDDNNGWPTEADGAGYSLELVGLGDPNSPDQWRASASPAGTPGAAPAPLPAPEALLSEIMADNVSAVRNGGKYPDWIEVVNVSGSSLDLGGWGLGDSEMTRRYIIPAGTLVAAGTPLLFWCDNDLAAPGRHTGFSLAREGETVSLYNPEGRRVDAVTFGAQLPDLSIAREGVAGAWVLSTPTPGQSNLPAPVAGTERLKVNEALSNSSPGGSDWVEIYNSDIALPAALGLATLSNGSSHTRLPALSFLAPGGFALFLANEQPGPLNLAFKLAASGAVVTLHDAAAVERSRLVLPSLPEGVSQGLLPDGSDIARRFDQSATPGASNYLPAHVGPTFSEILTSGAAGQAGWIEWFNPNATPFDFTGYGVELESRPGVRWLFPPGFKQGPGSFMVVQGDPSRPASSTAGEMNLGFRPSGDGDVVYLMDPAGRRAEGMAFGVQIAGRSLAKMGVMWGLAAEPTPGGPNSGAAPTGDAANLRVNEWLASSSLGDDWLELYNTDPLPVALAGLYLTDDPSIVGRTNTLIRPFSYIAPGGFALFRASGNYNLGFNHTRFKISQFGETLRLLSPSFLILDEVNLGPQVANGAQGRFPDGAAEIVAMATPTPGGPNRAPSADTDGDGLPDDWEKAHGLDPKNPADAALDSDGDGASNFQEFLAGTNPLDPASRLALQVVLGADGAPRLQFQAQPGLSYTVLWTDKIPSGEWRRLADIPATAGGPTTLADPAQSQTRFYRLTTPRLP